MPTAEKLPPASLGLGGDGDEIAAITEVERRFGVRIDYSGAQHWTTVGDVFAALQQVLTSERAKDCKTWPPFTQAISGETGVDPRQVTAETLLLGKARRDLRIALVIACVLGVAFAIVRHWRPSAVGSIAVTYEKGEVALSSPRRVFVGLGPAFAGMTGGVPVRHPGLDPG